MGVRSNIYSSIFSIFPWDLTLPFGRAPRPQNAQGHEDRQGPITIAHLESRAQRLTVEGWTCESLTHFNYLVVEPTNHLKNIISSNWIISPNGDEHRKHTFGTNFDQGFPPKETTEIPKCPAQFCRYIATTRHGVLSTWYLWTNGTLSKKTHRKLGQFLHCAKSGMIKQRSGATLKNLAMFLCCFV